MRILIAAALLAATLGAWGNPTRAHEGHDHDAAPPLTAAPSAPRVEAFSDTLELVAIVRGDKLAIYLDQFVSNAPVAGATLEVDTPAGTVSATVVGDSYELAAPWAAQPGTYDLIFTVTTPESADVLTGSLVVPATAPVTGPDNSAFVASLMARLRGGDSALMGGAGIGFLLGLLAAALAFGRRRLVAATMLLLLTTGLLYGSRAFADESREKGNAAPMAQTSATRDLAQRLPDGSIFVPKPTQRLLELRTIVSSADTFARTVELPGRIIPDPDASGVVQASVNGRLSPPSGGFPRLGAVVKAGDVLAYVTPPLTSAEASDQRQRQGDLDQQIAIIEQRLGRYERLIASGAVARVQMDEAKLELQGLRDRRAALDRSRREPEELIAPVSGVIAAVAAVAGQIAETNAVIFQIVDPARLWIEALSFEALSGVTEAAVRTAEGRILALDYKGSGLSDRMQSLPVHFAIRGGAGALRIGQLVTVVVTSSETASGIALPRTSVLEGPNGQAVVYEHTQAERFQPRDVRTIQLDAERVLIAAGLEPGKRIVTQGAELLNQVR